MSDERALEAAWEAFSVDMVAEAATERRQKARMLRAIEAYEAALWRPIEGNTWKTHEFIIVGWPQGGIHLAEWSHAQQHWLLVRPHHQAHEGDSEKRYISAARLCDLGAMFRTITPPPQNGDLLAREGTVSERSGEGKPRTPDDPCAA